MNIIPKRRRFRDNPYYIGFDEHKQQNVVTFIDSKGIYQKILIRKEIYDVFNSYELKDIAAMNEYDNHIEHLELNEEMLYEKIKTKEKGVAVFVEEKILIEELYKIIESLPDIQKRRVIKYFFYKKNYREIGMEEKCSKRAVKFSIDIAIKKISKKIRKEDYTNFI